jgi:hypothetical protein
VVEVNRRPLHTAVDLVVRVHPAASTPAAARAMTDLIPRALESIVDAPEAPVPDPEAAP